MKKLILASGSPTRKRLMTEAGFVFEVIPSDYEEDMTLALAPIELAKYLSRGKAEDVAKKFTEGVILGGDTFIVYQDKLLGKPHTPKRAREMLEMLRGREHFAITGFTIVDIETGSILSKSVETKVIFRNFTDKELNEYIATGEPLHKAGAYAVLEGGSMLVERIEGSITNIAGLPMEEVIEELKKFGVLPTFSTNMLVHDKIIIHE